MMRFYPFSFVAIVIFLLGFSSISKGQELSSTDPKYIEAFNVYQRIIHATGRTKRYPKLVITKNSQWKGAGYESIPSRRVILEESLFDLFVQKFGTKKDHALAVVLGHELAHYYKDHPPTSHFAAKTPNQSIQYEGEADYFGVFYGSLAGYQTITYMPQVLELIYKAYKLPDELMGYQSKKDRLASVKFPSQ